MRADKVGRDTMLAQIVQMVAEAQRSRAPIQRLADQVSGWFVPLVIATALLAFVAWAIWGPEPRFSLRAGGGRFGADHRLSLRARIGDADVDHGRRRTRRSVRRFDQERRSPGAVREGRHAGDRQDGHAHGGQAQSRGGAGLRRHRRGRSVAACRKPRTWQRTPARRSDCRGRDRAQARARAGSGLRCSIRQGRHRGYRGSADRHRQPADDAGPRDRCRVA